MFYTKEVIKKLFIALIFIAVLFFGQTIISAGCYTGSDGWVICTNPDGSTPRATTCDQLSGIGTETCGAGSGCGLTGCYNCAAQGTCNGGGGGGGTNCGAGQVYDSCASGSDCPKSQQARTVCDPTYVCGRTENHCPVTENYACPYCPTWYEPCTNQTNWQCNGGIQCTDQWGCYRDDDGQRICGFYQDCSCPGGWQEVTSCVGGGCIGGEQWTTCTRTTSDPCAGTYSDQYCGGGNCRQESFYGCNPGTTSSCQGGCVSLPCNSVAPSVPGLTSPASGSEISGTETSLAGATAGWGTTCSGQNYQFNIYVDECAAIMTPTTLWKTVAASGNNFNQIFTGLGGKGYCWTASATNGVTTSAKALAQRFVFSDQPWWQVKDGSVMTFGGVTSMVGKNQKFIADTPGVVISGTGNVFLNGADANANKWVVTDGLLSQKVSYRYDYDYVSARIISTIKPAVGPSLAATANDLKVGSPENGVYYVQTTGNLDIVGDLDFGSNRVVVLVTGDANIKGKINFTKNQGLFALYVKGNINIDPSIGTVSGTGVDPTTLPPHLEGLYLAQGAINTGVAASQLRLEGSFVGIGGVNLQRNLNSAWPSEYFVFRPDILVNLPKQLLRQNHIWQELAP